MSLFSWLGIAVFASWGIASIAAQWKDGPMKILPADFRHFVNRWAFFSPSPGVHDFYLLFRSKFENGEIGPWAKALEPGERMPIHLIWHPEGRKKKALIGAVKLLSADGFEAFDPQEIKANTGYLSILSMVLAVPGQPSEVARQFMLLRKNSAELGSEPEMVIVSDFFKAA